MTLPSDVFDYETRIGTLFRGSSERKYKKNQLIFYEGDDLTHFCLIRKGYVKAYSILDSGEQRTIFLLGPHDLFPIAVSLTHEMRKYKLRYFYESLNDVVIATMPLDQFIKQIEDFRNQTIFISYLAATNEAMMDQLDIMKSKKAVNKVANFLPYIVRKYGKLVAKDTYQLKIKLTHQEVADLAGLTRETASQQIKYLEEIGILDQSHGYWTVNESKLAKEGFTKP